jgi:hypothetical protein
MVINMLICLFHLLNFNLTYQDNSIVTETIKTPVLQTISQCNTIWKYCTDGYQQNYLTFWNYKFQNGL